MTYVMDVYRKISKDDTFTAQATVFGHDVDLSVRNIQEIRQTLNPPQLLLNKTYYPDRISFCEISFELTAFGIVHGHRMPIDAYDVYHSLHKAARELTKCVDYNNMQMAMDAGSFNFLGIELLLSHYEMQINANTLTIGARPTLRNIKT